MIDSQRQAARERERRARTGIRLYGFADQHRLADSAGTGLSLSGRVGSGTRTTSGDLVLSVTVMVDGAPVLFQSEDGECFVGMAETMSNVTGSFVCEELMSADGRMKVKITGNYKT